jgi:hypothetical protein
MLDKYKIYLTIYREDFYFVDRFHGSMLHGDRGAACCEAHTTFADESACPQVDYFPYFQMLSAIRHADSLAKLTCA